LLPEHDRYVGKNWVHMLYRMGNVRVFLGLVSGEVLYVSYRMYAYVHACQ